MFAASQFMFTGGRSRLRPRTLQARRDDPSGVVCDVMACDRIRSREIHRGLDFARRVANRVGARHCVGDSYSYWRRLTRHAERTDWPA